MTRRIRFFLSHLALSVGIIIVSGVAMMVVWFPVPYRTAGSGFAILAILAAVDVVLGPLMTLLLVSAKKSLAEITLDLSIVTLVQLSALAYGVHSVFIARPVHTVFEIDRFAGVFANDIIIEDLSSALPEFRQLPLTGPTLISARKATLQTETELMNAVNLALGGFDLSTQPKRWVPYRDTVDDVLKMSRSARLLINAYPALRQDLDGLAKAEKVSPDQLRFLPMVIHKVQWTAVLAPDASRILDYYHVDGFID